MHMHHLPFYAIFSTAVYFGVSMVKSGGAKIPEKLESEIQDLAPNKQPLWQRFLGEGLRNLHDTKAIKKQPAKTQVVLRNKKMPAVFLCTSPPIGIGILDSHPHRSCFRTQGRPRSCHQGGDARTKASQSCQSSKPGGEQRRCTAAGLEPIDDFGDVGLRQLRPDPSSCVAAAARCQLAESEDCQFC